MLCSAAGAVMLGFAGIFYRLAEPTPETGAFFRFVLAVPLLAALAWRERGPALTDRPAVLRAGVLVAVDMVLWHYAIEDVGAGLGTVLANTQVVFMVLVSRWALGERLPVRGSVGIAIVCAGVVLVAGVLDAAPYGEHPVRGTLLAVAAGLTSALYILTLRQANADPLRPVAPLLYATVVGAGCAGVAGAAAGNLDLAPTAEQLLWLGLLATTSQVLGWLLLSVPLRALAATTTSIVLNAQPVAALIFAAVILSETPSALQLAGGCVIVAGLLVATSRQPAPPVATTPDPTRL